MLRREVRSDAWTVAVAARQGEGEFVDMRVARPRLASGDGLIRAALASGRAGPCQRPPHYKLTYPYLSLFILMYIDILLNNAK